jgi:signal transduction histidine kinase
VQQLSLDYRPTMLDNLGLVPTLQWYFQRYTNRTGVAVTFKHNVVEQRFPTEKETAAFRIIQEALTNVARHAGRKEVTVRLWVNAYALHVQVEDQGTGFDVAAKLASGTSSGLTGMRERATLLGGNVTVESAPGAGTQVTAELPFASCLSSEQWEGSPP